MMKLDWKELLLAFSIVLIPNAVMFGMALWVDVNRPFINVDYVFVALLVAICPRWVSLPVFAVCLFLDALGLVRQIIPVVNVVDSLYLVGFIGVAPLLYQLAFVVSILVSVLLVWIVWKFSPNTSRESLVVVVNLFLLAYVINVFFVGDKGATYRKPGEAVIASQAIYAYEASIGGFVSGFSDYDGTPFEDKKVEGATREWMKNPGLVGDKVLLIVSESWGVVEEDIQNSVLAPLRGSAVVTEFSQGVLDVAGVTVQGELRELCGLRPRYLNLEGVTEGFAECLPNRYKGMGFSTMAVHGAAGSMYGRRQWYPRLGFQEMIFFESKQWQSRCYSFPGACDSEIAREVSSFFDSHDKTFVYWLTLNSHVPYDKRDLTIGSFDCKANGVKEPSSACRNLMLHSQFFYYLEKVLHSKGMNGVRVVIVGDHQPPLFGDYDRSLFSKSRVPWIKFSVNSKE